MTMTSMSYTTGAHCGRNATRAALAAIVLALATSCAGEKECATCPERDAVTCETALADVTGQGHDGAPPEQVEADAPAVCPDAGGCPDAAACDACRTCPEVEACVPDCAGKACGDDGCGVACGHCAADEACYDGVCAPEGPCGIQQCGVAYDEPQWVTCGWCADGAVCRGGQCVEVPCLYGPDCWSEDLLPEGLAHTCVRESFEGFGACRYRLADDGEVLTSLRRIYDGAAMYLGKERLTIDGDPAACTLPVAQDVTPIEATCCAAQGGPDKDGDSLCDADAWAWNDWAGTWSSLGFSLLGEHAFTYAFQPEATAPGASTPSPFVAYAYGDLDCDTFQETFFLAGKAGASPCTLDTPEAVGVLLPAPWAAGPLAQPVTLPVALEEGQRAMFRVSPEYMGPQSESMNPHFDEAKQNLQRLAEGLAAAWEKGTPGACAFPPPMGVSPIEGTCCSSIGGPDADADALCDADPLVWIWGAWLDLGFALTTEHAFVVATGAASPTRAKAIAYSDLDCDTIQSTFVRFVQGTDTCTACEAAIVDGWYIEYENE